MSTLTTGDGNLTRIQYAIIDVEIAVREQTKVLLLLLEELKNLTAEGARRGKEKSHP